MDARLCKCRTVVITRYPAGCRENGRKYRIGIPMEGPRLVVCNKVETSRRTEFKNRYRLVPVWFLPLRGCHPTTLDTTCHMPSFAQRARFKVSFQSDSLIPDLQDSYLTDIK